MAKTIVFAQQKGGVGKTTDTVMAALVAAQVYRKKVLVIDTDLQHNATDFLSKTFDHYEFPKSLMQCVADGDLRDGIVSLTDTLDLIPGAGDMREFVSFLEEKFSTVVDKTFYLSKLLSKVRDNYDYIFIDVPPSTNLQVDNVMVAADYVVIVQEMKQFSFDGSKALVSSYLQILVDDFGDRIKTQIAGVLPVLFDSRSKLQQTLMKEVVSYFGEDNVFSTIIRNHERLEVYGAQGAQFNDYHDRRMFALFSDIFSEMEERIQLFENTGDIVNYTYNPKYYVNGKLTPLGKELTAYGLTEER